MSRAQTGPPDRGAHAGPAEEAIPGLSGRAEPGPSQLSDEEKKIIKTKQPLYGLSSRKVKGDRVRMALVCWGLLGSLPMLIGRDLGQRREPVYPAAPHASV